MLGITYRWIFKAADDFSYVLSSELMHAEQLTIFMKPNVNDRYFFKFNECRRYQLVTDMAIPSVLYILCVYELMTSYNTFDGVNTKTTAFFSNK